MPQFTPTSLARLLRNVETSVLREAIDDAGLWDLFSSFERDVLVEIGQEQNLLANLKVSGPAALDLLGQEFFSRVEAVAGDAPIVPQLLFRSAHQTWQNINALRDLINSLFETIEPPEIPQTGGENTLGVVHDRVIEAKAWIRLIREGSHEDFHPTPLADTYLENAKEALDDAQLLLESHPETYPEE